MCVHAHTVCFYHKFYINILKELLNNTIRLTNFKHKHVDTDYVSKSIWMNYGHVAVWLQTISSYSNALVFCQLAH